MTIPDARLVDERLANLLSHARHKVERNTGFSDALSKLELEFWTDQVAAYTELQQLRAANQQGREWVAIGDGLPEPEIIVLGQYKDSYELIKLRLHPSGDYWLAHDEPVCMMPPIAWQPLPPPYQGAK